MTAPAEQVANDHQPYEAIGGGTDCCCGWQERRVGPSFTEHVIAAYEAARHG